MFSKSYYILLLLHLISHTLGFVPCKTVWEPYFIGDENFPQNIVSLQKNKYVARISAVKNFNNTTKSTLGTFNLETKAFQAIDGSEYLCIEVLTNPYNCLLGWELKSNEDKLFFSKNEDSQIIIRQYTNNQWIPGLLDPTQLNKEMNDDTQFLISKDFGFHTEIKSIFVHQNQVSDYEKLFEFIGSTSIQNLSPAEIEETVTHEQELEETTSNQDHNGMVHLNRTLVETKRPLLPIYDYIGNSRGQTEYDEVGTTTTTKTLVTATRKIKVPGYMSVSVCSFATLTETLLQNYTAEAIISLPGWSGAELRNIYESINAQYKILNILED